MLDFFAFESLAVTLALEADVYDFDVPLRVLCRPRTRYYDIRAKLGRHRRNHERDLVDSGRRVDRLCLLHGERDEGSGCALVVFSAASRSLSCGYLSRLTNDGFRRGELRASVTRDDQGDEIAPLSCCVIVVETGGRDVK